MELNEVIYHQKLQLITVTDSGEILTTGNTLFDLEVAHNIKDFHPVFETTLEQMDQTNLSELLIPGLSITNDQNQIYCDVRLTQEREFISILFFNFTSKYKNKISSVSERNNTEIRRNKKMHQMHTSFVIKNM